MNKSEIMKELYKQKPCAKFQMIRKSVAYYEANIKQGRVGFEVPVSDMGDADFTDVMDAKLLNRYITGLL